MDNDRSGEEWPKALKARVIKMIDALPDDATVDDIVETLDFVLTVELRLANIDSERMIPHEEVEKRIKEWTRQSRRSNS